MNGNLQVSSSTIPISIGSPENSCYGNFGQGQPGIQGNTAAIPIYDNLIEKTLSCSANTSIAGAGNSGTKETGQCATF